MFKNQYLVQPIHSTEVLRTEIIFMLLSHWPGLLCATARVPPGAWQERGATGERDARLPAVGGGGAAQAAIQTTGYRPQGYQVYTQTCLQFVH